MRKPFLAFLVLYLGTFLFFQEEIHRLSHHLDEKKPGIAQPCHFHDLFIQDSVSRISFFSLMAPKLLKVTYFFPKKMALSENFIFFLPLSRAPPKLS